MRYVRYLTPYAPFLLGAALAGCVSETVRVVDMTPPEQLAWDVPEELLLDVGIAGVRRQRARRVRPSRSPSTSSRRCGAPKATTCAFFFKNLLQSTGNWGAVRVVPRSPTHAVDVTVTATIEHSDGESPEAPRPRRGRRARSRSGSSVDYRALASSYAYEDTVPAATRLPTLLPDRLPHLLADDLLAHLKTLSPEDIRAIRTTAELQFRARLRAGRLCGVRGRHAQGAGDDRTTARRERPHARPRPPDPPSASTSSSSTTLDEHYATFSASMFAPYQNWRHATYDEAIAYKRAKQQARARIMAGSAAVIGGIAAQTQADDNRHPLRRPREHHRGRRNPEDRHRQARPGEGARRGPAGTRDLRRGGDRARTRSNSRTRRCACRGRSTSSTRSCGAS